jgi:hypothetical protein
MRRSEARLSRCCFQIRTFRFDTVRKHENIFGKGESKNLWKGRIRKTVSAHWKIEEKKEKVTKPQQLQLQPQPTTDGPESFTATTVKW